MKLGSSDYFVMGVSALGVAWALNSVLKADLPEGCFRSMADNQLYLVQEDKASVANNAWRMSEDKQTCFQSEGGGSFVSIPVIEYP